MPREKEDACAAPSCATKRGVILRCERSEPRRMDAYSARLQRRDIGAVVLRGPRFARPPQDDGSRAHQPLDLGTQRGRDVGTVQCIGDIGGEEADLRSAIETLAREFQSVEGL